MSAWCYCCLIYRFWFRHGLTKNCCNQQLPLYKRNHHHCSPNTITTTLMIAKEENKLPVLHPDTLTCIIMWELEVVLYMESHTPIKTSYLRNIQIRHQSPDYQDEKFFLVLINSQEWWPVPGKLCLQRYLEAPPCTPLPSKSSLQWIFDVHIKDEIHSVIFM